MGYTPPKKGATSREYINSILLTQSGGNEMHDDLIYHSELIRESINIGFSVVSVVLIAIWWQLKGIKDKL